MPTMGQVLRALRVDLDLSMGEAARALGVSTVHYSAVENDKGAQVTAAQLAELLLRRASAGKHLPDLARSYGELNAQLGRADGVVLSRGTAPDDKQYARGVADVLAWLLGCPSETAFSKEVMR
jgi:transcriptional regulator with XRE-family HTH domain